MGSGGGAVRFYYLTLLSILAYGSAAHAQTSPAVEPKSVVAPQPGMDIATLQGQRAKLFERMLEKPDDLDAAFQYAALSVQAGDLEAAVSTLERMLIFAPGLPRLQLELGVLYFRLGAYETARTYFQAAIAAPDVPPEVRAKVEQYLGGIDQAGIQTRFTGQVRAGIRHQTNANRAPGVGTVLTTGGLVIDPGSVGTPDWNVYGAGLFHLTHELPSQGDSLEADLVVYGSKQFEREELDTALAELTFGPAFDLGRFGIDNGALGLYGIGSGVFVDDHFYSAAGGAGVRLVLRPSARFSSVSAFEYRYRDYHDSSAAPTASDRDGNEFRGFTSGTYILSPTLLLGGNAYVQRSEARFGRLTYTEAGFAANLSRSFASPFGGEHGPWTVTPSAGFVYRSYDDPDPAINPAEAETDREAFVGLNLLVPVGKAWALLAEGEYRNVNSNYAIRDYDNVSVTLSVVKRF